jgi:predicted aldo/keto reductase-like oxidoreductase
MLGQALKGVRDKVNIISKHYGYRTPSTPVSKDLIIEKVNGSLKRLQTDHIDVSLTHALDGEDDIKRFLKNESLMEGYAQLKKEGKIRFTGFSTHNAKLLLQEALKPEYSEFVQVIMFIYNHMEGKEIEPLIKQLHDKGIGTIAMKTLAGGQQGNLKGFINKDTSYPHAAIAWVLGNPNIDCAVTSMRSFSHVEEYIAASGKRLERKDLAILREYRREVSDKYCRVSCTKCEPSCPYGVAISNVMRYEMYFINYGHEKVAIDNYAHLDDKKKPKDCSNCSGHCNSACPFGIKVQNRLIHADKILSV